MFLENCGEVIRVLCGNKEGNWVISYDNPCTPKFVLRDDLRAMERIEPPKDFQMRMTQEQTPGQKKRQELISELLEKEIFDIKHEMLTMQSEIDKAKEKIKELSDEKQKGTAQSSADRRR